MDLFHWAGLALGAMICIGALLLARGQQGLSPMHVVVIGIGAVLAGVPVITMSFGAQPSFQIGQVVQAASQTNAATQAQAQAIGALNNRVTQLASLVSKLPIGITASTGSPPTPAPAPVANASAPNLTKGSALIIPPEVLPAWKKNVAAFQQSGTDVERLNSQSERLTASSGAALARSALPK